MSAGAVRLRRLFFALWPDEPTRGAIHHATRAAVRDCGGKPVPAANLHLTLAFLGNVPEERVAAIAEAAREVPVPSLALTLDRYGWFDAAQVLWVGPSAVPAALGHLAGDLWRAMAVAGLPPDARPFHPHVTLARRVAAPPAPGAPRTVAWPVAGFALLESADGRYRGIASYPADPRETR